MPTFLTSCLRFDRDLKGSIGEFLDVQMLCHIITNK